MEKKIEVCGGECGGLGADPALRRRCRGVRAVEEIRGDDGPPVPARLIHSNGYPQRPPGRPRQNPQRLGQGSLQRLSGSHGRFFFSASVSDS